MHLAETDLPADASQLLASLRALGAEFWAEDGQLRYRAAKGLLNDGHLTQLRRNKADILALLDAEQGRRQATADAAARFDPFPLTDVQAAYLLGRQHSFGLGGVACHGYLEVTYPELDGDTLEDAWNRLIHRHDMLRAVIEQTGHQHVLPEVPAYRIARTDLRHATADALQAHLKATRAAMDHRVYPSDVWPLFELRLTRTPAGDIVHFSLDSLIADWASAGVLFTELDALLAGDADRLPALDITFRDYLQAQRSLSDTPEYEDDRRYWMTRVDTLPAAPELPAAPHDDGQVPNRFRRLSWRLPADRWSTLCTRAQAHGLTPSVAVLTAYASVLQRWSRHERFCLNLTLLNRLALHPQVNLLVGDFTSVTLLEVPAAAGRNYAQRAAELGGQLFADLDHRLFSGVEVMREIARRRGRDAASMPIVYTSAIGLGDGQPPASGRRHGNGITQTPQVSLDCQVMDDAQGLEVNWDIRNGLLPPGVAEDMHASFCALLDALARDDGAWTASQPLPLPAAQQAERDRANATAGLLPDTLLHHGVIEQALQRPEAVAVIDRDGTLRYGALARRALAVARTLRAQGSNAGDRVAILMHKGADQIVAVLGVLLAGASYLPVDPEQPQARRAHMLAGATAHCVLTQSWCAAAQDLPEPFRMIAVDTLPEIDAMPEPPHGDPDSLAYVIYTSGSTGAPKGVMISHRAALNTVQDINRRHGIGAADRALGLAQLSFDLSVYDIFGPLSAGAALVLPDPERGADPSHWAELVAGHGVTIWNSVPAQLQMLTGYLDAEPTPLSSLRLVMLSGDWVPVTLPEHIRRHVPDIRLVALGGATEAAIWSNAHRIDSVSPEWSSIPYGRPLANQGLRVLNDSLADAPTWVAGELYITGHGLAQGYLGDAALTDARFFAHPRDGQRVYRTGDLARYLPGGEVEFLGREDGQVKIRGHRIELGEIEAALLSHPAVGAAAVVAAGGRGEERTLLAYAESAAADETDDGAAPRLAQAAAQLADSQVSPAAADCAAFLTHALHDAALATMLNALVECGLFATPEQRHSEDAVQAQARVAERHRWLLRRWLGLLTQAGWLDRDLDGGYARLRDVSAATVQAAWQALNAGVEAGLWTDDFLDYHHRHAALLHDLLEDRQNPFDLLFPEGRDAYALAVYRDLAAARYNNHAVAAVLNRLAAARPADAAPLRILEIGAGTGATTSVALPLLEGYAVDYLYTDLTTFFLADARQRHTRPDIRFGLLDLDGDYRAQGYAPNSADVIVCAGILSSVRDVDTALANAVELLAPGGWLLLTEPTAALPQILLTQGFMMTPPEDGLDDGIRPFLSAKAWRERLREHGGRVAVDLPPDGHALADAQMRMMAAQFKTGRKPLRADDLATFLAGRLPAYMQPAHVQIVDRLPLTANNKVDRSLLTRWRPVPAALDTQAARDAGADALETELCTVWAEALGIAQIGREENFYDRGADSLILARVAGRLRESLPQAQAYTYDALLRQMLNEPNVGALAQALRAGPVDAPAAGATNTGAAAEAGDSPYGRQPGSNAVLLPFGGSDDGPLRVMFHAALGTMDYFQHLGNALARQALGTVLGIAVADADLYTSGPTQGLIDSVADDYAARLAATEHVRFQLIGYCLGGLLATEVARRLLERGLDVMDLTLIDSIPMFVDTDEELAFESIFVPNLNLDPVATVFGPDVDSADLYRAIDLLMARHGNKVPAGALADLDGDAGLRCVAEAARKRYAIPQAQRLHAYAQAAASQRGVPIDPEMVPAFFRVCRHSMRAARADLPPYVGDMRYLRCQEQQSFGITAGVGHLAADYWQHVCLGHFEMIDVPGNHFSVIEPPLVDVVAEHLAQPLLRMPRGDAHALA